MRPVLYKPSSAGGGVFATFGMMESSCVGREFPGGFKFGALGNLGGNPILLLDYAARVSFGLHHVLHYQVTEAAALLEGCGCRVPLLEGLDGQLFEEVLVVSLRSLTGSASLGTRHVSLPRLGRSAIWVAVLAASSLGIRANAQSADSRLPRDVSLPHQGEHGKVIVVGLLGGFVPSNDPHHPEVQLVRELQQQYPAGAYFRVFENHKINDAYRAILQQLDLDQTESSTGQNAQPARVVLFGHSWGASAVVRLARKLEREGVPVALTVQVDSVAKPFSDDGLIPANVAEAVNFYQTRGLIHGRPEIRAADPTRTKIIGNFRREYKTEPSACRQFSWYSRLFTKGHIEIECDPEVWSEVRMLLNAYLPHEIAQNPAPIRTVAGTAGGLPPDRFISVR